MKICLDSLDNQTFRDFEVIVCDDGSTDNTKEVTELYKGRLNLKYSWSQNWGGPARPRNNGIKLATGQWICFLDSDDWWYPKKLEICLKHLESSDLIYHEFDYYTQNGKISKKVVNARHLKKDVFADLLLNSNAIPNSSVVVRKELLERVGLLSEDPELIAVEDFDCWLRLANVTNRFTFISKPLGGYWIGSSNISLTEKHLKRELKLFEIHSQLLPRDVQIEAQKRFCYRIGRMEQNMGNIESAIVNYRKSIRCGKLVIVLKSFYFLFCLRLKKTEIKSAS